MILIFCFRNCIKGLLAGKIVLLSTHNSRYFKEADQIVHLRGGKIKEFKADSSDLMLLEKSTTQDKTLDNKYREYNKENDKNTTVQEDEERGFGRVAMKVYKEYLLYGTWPSVTFIVVLMFFTGQGKIVKIYP